MGIADTFNVNDIINKSDNKIDAKYYYFTPIATLTKPLIDKTPNAEKITWIISGNNSNNGNGNN